MQKPLSFSGYKRFITCPKYYYFHDVQGEKSEAKTSALVFGSAIDLAINGLLEGKDLRTAEYIATSYINAEQVDFYYPADYDSDLANDELQKQLEKAKYAGDADELISDLLKNQTQLSVNEKALLDKVIKKSLKVKAKIILDSYFLKVLPLIDKVESVQNEIVLPDGSKRGIIDMILILKDGRRVVFDNKTASRPYERDSVLKSPQLALYASMVNAEYAGFIVMNKQITKNRKKVCSKCSNDGSGTKFRTCNAIINKKKCGSEWNETIDPYSFIQIHIDKMPEINKNLINGAMDDTIKCIKNGIFPRNLNNCFNMYGAPCPYIKKCWEAK